MSARTITCSAPAKINWFLNLTARRADGYHELQSALQFLELHDTLVLTRREDSRIERRSGALGVGCSGDLTLRAAEVLQRQTQSPFGASITLTKRIPMGAGLGGGSSDAASTLVGLNHLWGAGLTAKDLAGLGLTLGADVPVFVYAQAAWAEGIGEQLTPIRLPELWLVVIYPNCHASTTEIFQDPRLTHNSWVRTIPGFLRAQSDKVSAKGVLADRDDDTGAERVFGIANNDCEPVARVRYPAIGEALDWLRRFVPARMTGTGSAVFGPCSSRSAAEAVARCVPQKWGAFVTRTMNRSSLCDELF